MKYGSAPRLLITDREGALYLERSTIKVENGSVVYYSTEDAECKKYNIPHVNLAVLFVGQGCSITQDAIRLLSEERVHVAVTGTGGTPLHMGSLTTYTSTNHFIKMLKVYQNTDLSLAAMKIVMSVRVDNMLSVGVPNIKRFLRTRDTKKIETVCKQFKSNIDKSESIQELLGYEGNFSKKCYATLAELSGVDTFKRTTGSLVRGSGTATQQANSFIDHGNYLSYGMAGAALWALGIPPQMSIFHGKTRPGGLVFDIADSFKDSFVLPLAFSSAVNQNSDFRSKLLTEFDDKRILKKAIEVIDNITSLE